MNKKRVKRETQKTMRLKIVNKNVPLQVHQQPLQQHLQP
jgi:hypothetical protein